MATSTTLLSGCKKELVAYQDTYLDGIHKIHGCSIIKSGNFGNIPKTLLNIQDQIEDQKYEEFSKN
ncbi:unnamed protein product [Moneuplotes crassus]|uniref:Uncharacterized protein n=1 Tax=Euplotes crassus TaxID=5936 RepID=A0AAD1X7D4_EUPCR|nr:unnamed protein product [Moneuplotes crassus]